MFTKYIYFCSVATSLNDFDSFWATRKLIMVILIMKSVQRSDQGARSWWRLWLCQKAWRHWECWGSWEITSSKMRVKRYFLMSWTHSKLMNYGMSARTTAVSSGHILKRKQNVIMSQKWKKNTVFATEKTIFVKSAALRNKILCCKYKERTED